MGSVDSRYSVLDYTVLVHSPDSEDYSTYFGVLVHCPGPPKLDNQNGGVDNP